MGARGEREMDGRRGDLERDGDRERGRRAGERDIETSRSSLPAGGESGFGERERPLSDMSRLYALDVWCY